MSEAAGRKVHRQRALLRLVGERTLATQADLVRALRSAGVRSTQATVSRDIVDLGLVKVARDGHHAYAPPAAPFASGVERLRRFCEDYPVEAACAGNLVVLRSLPGSASTLAVALEAAGFTEIVGTIAGDDTVFVAVPHERAGVALAERLDGFGVVRHPTSREREK